MTNNIILAALYIRCSTDMQAETSPEQQRQLAEKYALENNYKIIVSFEDIGKSGISFEKRPGFNSLLKAVQSNPPFQAVLVLINQDGVVQEQAAASTIRNCSREPEMWTW